MAKNYITFIDSTGRNVLGEFVKRELGTVHVKNAVMVTVQPQADNKLTVQLIPLFLAEFIKTSPTGDRSYTYAFPEATIAEGVNFEIDARIASQYDKIIESTFAPKPATPEVIKLFED